MFGLMRSFVPFIAYETPADSGGGEVAPVTPPPVAPAAPVAPADPMADANAAMASRVLGTASPDELLPDGAPYRDAAALRAEIAATRERFGPVAQLPPPLQEQVIRFAPGYALASADPSLLPDVQTLHGAYGALPPEDRAIVDRILGDALTGTGDARADIREAARLLREDPDAPPAGAPVAAPAVPGEPDAFGFDADDPNRPMTVAEFQRLIGTAATEQQTAAAVDREYAAITSEARELGYDPESQDPNVQQRYQQLIDEAQRTPDGSLAQAHERLLTQQQWIIDQYVAGKLADANRPQPSAAGATPSGERVLESLDDSERAMRERVAALGHRVPGMQTG